MTVVGTPEVVFRSCLIDVEGKTFNGLAVKWNPKKRVNYCFPGEMNPFNVLVLKL